MNKIKEYVAYIKLMQPMGKARLILLGLEVFLILVVAGVGLQAISMVYVISMVIISTLYVVVVILDTLK